MAKKLKLEISETARAELVEIWGWNELVYGGAHADAYIENLVTAMK